MDGLARDWMSDAEALAWTAERDRLLRATHATLWLLDRAPDRGRFEWKIERATRDVPRLRERVVEDPLGIAVPRWQVDPAFDLAYHVRFLRAPEDGSLRALLDLAEPLVMQGFDRDRPLWELYLIEGFPRGRAALLVKWHPALEGDRGLTALGGALVERFRAPESDWVPQPVPAPSHEEQGIVAESLAALARRARSDASLLRELGVDAARFLTLLVLSGGRSGVDFGQGFASLARALRGNDAPGSPLLAERSAALRLDSFTLPLADLTRAARAARATIGDALVAGVAAGLELYHGLHGAPIEFLRISPPVDRREGGDAEAGACAALLGSLALPVPARGADAIERVREVHARVREHRRIWPRPEAISRAVSRLPTGAAAAVLGRAGCSIDFAASILAAPTSHLYVSGARVERILAFAPLAGAAAHVTAFAYDGTLAIGLGTDRAAVPDPEVLVGCVQRALADMVAEAARLAGRGRQAA
jgi:WS/DGAT/MGAT family acyltransferase